jgi:hypothetical protein
MMKYLPILAVILTILMSPIASHAAEPAAPAIYQSCYRGAPIVEIAWPTPSQGTRAAQVDFSYYVSFYQAVDTGPLPATSTSTVYVGLADAAKLWYRVGLLQANGSWQYSEGQQFTTPNCKLIRLPAVPATSDQGSTRQGGTSESSTSQVQTERNTSESSGELEITSVNSPRPGQDALVSIAGAPNTTCSIEYLTPIGNVADAQGLNSKRTDSGGRASWSWRIGTNTRPGTGTIDVQCGDQAASSSIEILPPASAQVR